MTVITTNTGALMAARQGQTMQSRVQTAQLRLSSGLRVNSASDDAAGLAVANKMQSQLRGMNIALKNTADGLSLLQTAIAGMQTSLDISQRLRELAVQSHNGVYTNDDRNNLQMEATTLVAELNKIATNTKFNDVNLLDGTYDRDMRVGNTNAEVVRVTIDGMGINKHINEESYAFGSSTQILSPTETATGTSAFDLKATSMAEGVMNPVYLASTTASGVSNFNTPASSTGSKNSSDAAYLSSAIATGSSVSNLPNQSNATSVSDTPLTHAFTNAEIRNASVSSTSTFTSKGFNNGDFSDGSSTQNGNVVSIPGWDITLGAIDLGPDDGPWDDTIGGHPTPIDNKTPNTMQTGVDTDATGYPRPHIGEPNTFGNPNYLWGVSDGELRLQTSSFSLPNYGIHHGPYVVSQAAVDLEVGDSVSFEWFGMSGGDAYDIYGYLLEEDTGQTITLVNDSGKERQSSKDVVPSSNDGWVSASANVNTAGNYKFVFISGTYDWSGGTVVGNGLKIRNVDVQQANPPAQNELKAKVTVQAVESNQVRIGNNLLTSAQTSVINDPGGTFSILAQGADHSKFTINTNTGNITSNSQLKFDVQNSYEFVVRYTGPGGIQHDETVTLKLTPHDEASSVITAQESNKVTINPTELPSFKKFMDFEASRPGGQVLTYQIEAYTDNDANPGNNGTPGDHQLFSINNATGVITSNGGLDFTNDPDYHFNLRATAADGRSFVDHVILNLTDTFSSTANLTVEETDQIIINIGNLTQSASFAGRYPGGTYSIGAGLDGAAFSVVGGQVIANDTFRIPNKSNYSFDLLYTQGTNVHTERVNIDLTRYLQSDTVLSAHEAGQVNLGKDIFGELDAFAASDGYRGTYLLERYDNNDGNPGNDGDADDFSQFAMNADGSVYSKTALDFTTENQFHFNKVYTASDGRVFTDRVILNLTDTLSSTASMQVEESNQVVINISDLTASNTYATRNPGGDFSVVSANNLFQVVGNQIIANKEFRKEDQSQYTFDLIYSHGGTQHTESVTVDLTRFMQSQGTLTADEANMVIMGSDAFEHLFSFTNDNLGGAYSLTGADATLFELNDSGDVVSKNPLDYDIQKTYNFNVTYTMPGGVAFNSQVQLDLRDTLASKATLQCEEAREVIVNGNTLTSLKAHALKDGNQGYFELLTQGDYDKFTMAADGTLTSKGELRMSVDPELDVYIKYHGVGVDDMVEHVRIQLTPTQYDHSRSQFIAKESGEVVIVPQLNTYMQAYAAADNYAGRWEIAQSPYAVDINTAFFEVADNTGQLKTTQRVDFESGKTDFEIILYYHHSSNTKKYTDFLHLNIINDKRDDNNLALEDIDISTREGAAAAAIHLQNVIDRINNAQAKLGAIENRFTHNVDNLSMAVLNTEEAAGRILDADFALESTRLARSQILDQAATDMLVRANQAKQNLLMLINN